MFKSKKTIKFLFFFLVIFALQSVLLLVLLLQPENANAQSQGVRVTPSKGTEPTDCPCGFAGNAEQRSQRLYIPIPGVTDACGYVCDVNQDGKGDIVDYILTIYKLLVGLAAIVAVFMIMIGGYTWIFAMGNSSKIESAKETVFSAAFGLGLALISVQLLTIINPRLVDIGLPNVETISPVADSVFCKDDDWVVEIPLLLGEKANPGFVLDFFEEPDEWKEVEEIKSNLQCTHSYAVAVRFTKNTVFCYAGDKGICRKKSEVTAAETSGKTLTVKEPEQAPICSGRTGCQSEEVCFPKGQLASCQNPEELCKAQGKNSCSLINEDLAKAQYVKKSCAKRIDTWKSGLIFGAADECVFGERLECQTGYRQAVGDEYWSKNAEGKGKCWELDSDKQQVPKDCTSFDGRPVYAVLSGDAVKDATALCCKDETEDKYMCETKNTQSMAKAQALCAGLQAGAVCDSSLQRAGGGAKRQNHICKDSSVLIAVELAGPTYKLQETKLVLCTLPTKKICYAMTTDTGSRIIDQTRDTCIDNFATYLTTLPSPITITGATAEEKVYKGPIADIKKPFPEYGMCDGVFTSKRVTCQ